MGPPSSLSDHPGFYATNKESHYCITMAVLILFYTFFPHRSDHCKNKKKPNKQKRSDHYYPGIYIYTAKVGREVTQKT